MNPETTLVWHPLQGKLKDLRMSCLLNDERPPHWQRIENIAGSGFPDLWWGWGTSGTIELKHRGAKPAGADTPCVISSISPQQRLFWRQAHEAGVNCHVLTRVGMEWFLHPSDWARRLLGIVPIAEMRSQNMLGAGQDEVRELPTASLLLGLCGARP